VVDVPVAERRLTSGLSVRARGWALAALLRRHWAVAVVVAGGVALRIVALVAIYPGIWFSDSNGYIRAAATGTLSVTRVDGYSLVVAPFWHLASAGALIVVQHVVGLGLVVLLYALLVRRGVPRWLAVVGVVPAAVDAYLVLIEHTVMSETVFHASIVGALAVLLWNERPGPVAGVVGGLLLGYATVVRSAAIPFIAIVVVYLLVRRIGWRPVVAACLGWAVIAGAYATVFKAEHGAFAFTQSGGRFLYGKVAPFADCAQLGDLSASERALCPDPRHRLTTNQYMWSRRSPMHGLPPEADSRIGAFALRVVRAEPLTYARVVTEDVLHYFRPGHHIGYNDYPVAPWQFPADPRRFGPPGFRGPIRPGNPERRKHHPITEPNVYVAQMAGRPRLDAGASRFLHDYQRYAYTAGPVLAFCLLLVGLALVLRRGGFRQRLDAALVAVLVLAALFMTQALSNFSYRYGLIAPLLLPVAGALAATALLEGRRRA
jgi:hypothetical protein